MNLLSINKITKSYTKTKLFDKASFSLQKGDKVGILGVNGTGKSTLLKMIVGLEEANNGSIVIADHVVVRYLPQNPQFPEEKTVLESVLAADGIRTVGKNDEIESQMEEVRDMKEQAESMLNIFGITDFSQKITELSDGQKKRVALAAVLFGRCDILILDEPADHLDHIMTEWLENYLKDFCGSLIMVTNDRYLLNSVSNRIMEIDNGKICSYDANYAGFLELKMQQEKTELETNTRRWRILCSELDYIQKGERARSAEHEAGSEQHVKRRNYRLFWDDRQMENPFVISWIGENTIEAKHISKAYGDKVLIKDFSFNLMKKDRLGIVGAKGCGKTTLVKMLCGWLEPDSGTVTVGHTINIGYYSQEFEDGKEGGDTYMDPDLRVIDYAHQTAQFSRTDDGLTSASSLLERFLFSPKQQRSTIGKLSFGEKRRLNLVRVLMEVPNVLVLDEPAKYLDIITMGLLEDYLDRYPGIVIIVSHDRYFLDRIAQHVLVFEEDGVLKEYEGGYTDYRDFVKLNELTKEQEEAEALLEEETEQLECPQGETEK